jgi:hypothetical protein
MSVVNFEPAQTGLYPRSYSDFQGESMMPNQAAQVDENKLNQFIGQMLGDLGGASSVAMVRLGGSLGLYETLYTHQQAHG